MFHSPVDDEYQRKHSTGTGSDDQLLSSLHGASDSDHTDHSHDEHEEHTFGDVIVHHSIHTIEYILGTVSNTASYLRLWALSLAHAQLSEVFWTKMMSEYGFLGKTGQSFAGAAVWAFATFGVIVCMDSLEVFLHCLRLHWVESMGKHFYGDGVKIRFFDFKGQEDE
jgi:V-type H+-transporting ATPase subunit a